MLAKPRALTSIGLIQVFLAAAFVIWLVFFPSTGNRFAWPVVPSFTAMFIGIGFIDRILIGYWLWRESSWPRLRWQVAANYAFLIVIFIATYWHIDEMNWKSNIIVAHIWVIAYTVEPIMLFLLEPRSPRSQSAVAGRAALWIDFRGVKERRSARGDHLRDHRGPGFHQPQIPGYALALAARSV